MSLKSNPLLFINTFLRREGEAVVTEAQYAAVSKGRPNVYDLRWQSKVRRVFFQ